MNKDEAKQKIQQLVEKYEKVKKLGQIKRYSEEDTKKDFILPLFEALGWNIVDRNEVSSEEHIKSAGLVDYGFYINNRAKFYLEAKPLEANLHKEDFAEQAIKYSWNRGITWAGLTDFESIKIFNAEAVSKYLGDKLVFEIPYDEYLSRFDQLWQLSKDAFETDSLDTYAEQIGKKLQKVPVSELLYKDLNECRNILLNTLKQWNSDKNISNELLEEGVQRLLDRLIFIRVLEDRGIEESTLHPLIRAWETSKKKTEVSIYESMVHKFREMDDTYNSNLFQNHPFENWEEHSDATKKVVEILYGKKGYYEYDFRAMPADVLGNVYENYLGRVLSQSKKGIEITQDPKKRKEQGIYYTPSFIVDYIVENALKPVLDKCNSIADLKKIKVLDPACGSGSFLIKALEVINEKYKEFGARGDEYTKLTILTENIYGVDLDDQAVEIARLNLLINALDSKMKLPSLSDNIKNGNSLISGTDEELEKYFGKNFRDKKPFSWEEKFPEVFAQGGFDAIIGNPPYIFARGGNFDEQEKKFYYDNFKLQKYQINTYLLFIEKAYGLLKENGYLGFIVPNNWLTINSFASLREFVLKEVGEVKIINAIDSIFLQASVDTCILVFRKSKPSQVEVGELKDGQFSYFNKHKPEDFYKNDFLINIKRSTDQNYNSILEKINQGIPLGDPSISIVKSGLVAYEVGKGKPSQSKEMRDERIYHSREKQSSDWIKYLDGVDVRRYSVVWSGEYIRYGNNLAAPRKPEIFQGERILVRQIPSQPPYCINATYTTEDYINDRNSNNILPIENGKFDLKFTLGVINSRLISYWFIHTFDKFQRKIFPQFKVNELAQFPIYPADKKQQKVIIELVDKMINLKNKLKKAEKNSNEWNNITEEIRRTDQKIDREVCKLYGLTPKEIAIVENK